jgi:hypothetical protein
MPHNQREKIMCLFKPLLQAGIFLLVLFPLGIQATQADPLDENSSDVQAPPATSEAYKISGNLMYFQRHRERYRVDESRFGSNLHHQTLQTSLDAASPYFADTIGFDLGVFATKDLHNSASPDHEINFFPWSNPWSADWSKKHARNGASLYRAHLKIRHASENAKWWGKVGYFQPTGPGVLGVNWSLMPGTYLGAEAGSEWGNLSVAGAYVTQYKAPWYKRTYHFMASETGHEVHHLWSLGARYGFTPHFSGEVAYGEAPGFLRNAHIKLKHNQNITPRSSLYLSYQLYGNGDRDESASPNNHYAGHWALQHYLALACTRAPYTLKTELLHTRAPSNEPQHLGYFVYRLSGHYGGTNGAYEPWWDNRSDWNHNRETAVFISLTRTLDDLIGFPGLTAGISAARGQGGKVYGVSQELKEQAWSLDLSYVIPSGNLKGTRFSLHYTHYDNKTDQPSWAGYKNLFQDERDVKFILIVPWKI